MVVARALLSIDTLGDVLVDDVEAEVQLTLRASVMATVLAQDRAYFGHIKLESCKKAERVPG